jgi:predicted  nucleic acid-binding Zn-ribbon protein
MKAEYPYRCTRCFEIFEEHTLIKCPECGDTVFEELISKAFVTLNEGQSVQESDTSKAQSELLHPDVMDAVDEYLAERKESNNNLKGDANIEDIRCYVNEEVKRCELLDPKGMVVITTNDLADMIKEYMNICYKMDEMISRPLPYKIYKWTKALDKCPEDGAIVFINPIPSNVIYAARYSQFQRRFFTSDDQIVFTEKRVEWLEEITNIPATNTPTPPQEQNDYWKGFDYALALLDEMYAKEHPHPHNIADCIKAKVNRLDNDKIRSNVRL